MEYAMCCGCMQSLPVSNMLQQIVHIANYSTGTVLMQCVAVTNRGRMRRVWRAWMELVEERWWRTQLQTRDHEIAHLAQQVSLRTCILTALHFHHQPMDGSNDSTDVLASLPMI